jgi:CubicO group peptidase (beta-lactamase class C family)
LEQAREVSGPPPDVVASLGRAVASRRGRAGVVGVAVIEGCEVAWTAAVGGGDDALFQAGSLSKTVTSALALELVQRGALDLDGDVAERLVSWRLPIGSGRVTLRDLLGHTSGANVRFYPGYEQTRAVPTLVQSLSGVEPATTAAVAFDPAAVGRFRYSGGGYAIAQQLIEDVTGAPFAEAARALVFEPLGMTRSTFLQPPPEALRVAVAQTGWRFYPECAAAGLWTTPADLARFICALQASATANPGAVSGATAEVMTSAHVALPFRGQWTLLALFGLARPHSHGLGLFVREARFINLGGAAGFFSALTGSLEDGTGAVVMTAACRTPLVLRILFELNDAQGWSGVRASPRPPPLQTISRRTSRLLLRAIS